MHPLTRILAPLLIVLGLGCAGLADLDLEGEPPPSSAWVGTWEGPGMTVRIDADGNVSVERRGDVITTVHAPAQSWSEDAVEVGIGRLTTRIRIDEAPYERNGTWHMVLDGVPLEKVAEGEPLPSEAPRGEPVPPPEEATEEPQGLAVPAEPI